MGMNLTHEFMAIVRTLKEANIPFAVCGGLAVAIHGFPRATVDIDIMVLEEDIPRIEALVAPMGFDISAGVIPIKSGTPQEQRVARVTKIQDGDFLTLDLMIVTPILKEIWDERISLKLDDIDVPIVSRNGLIQMKRWAGRPKDFIDLSELEASAQ